MPENASPLSYQDLENFLKLQYHTYELSADQDFWIGTNLHNVISPYTSVSEQEQNVRLLIESLNAKDFKCPNGGKSSH